MEKFEFTKPEFLFCEIPIKDGTQNDQRIWIYSTDSLSLIEFINIDEFTDFQFRVFKSVLNMKIVMEILKIILVFSLKTIVTLPIKIQTK